MIVSVLAMMFSFLPPRIGAFVLAFLALILLIFVFKLVSFVLDAIPFL